MPAMGGMARRASALRNYQRNNPSVPLLIVETGNSTRQTESLDEPANRWIVEAFNELGTHAVHATVGDLRRLNRLAELGKLPGSLGSDYISSVLDPSPGLAFAVKPYSIQTLKASEGGEEVRVGILAIAQASGEASPLGRLREPGEVLKRYLPEVEGQSDIVVVLTRLPDAEIVRLGRQFPGVDVIVNGAPTSEGREFEGAGTAVAVEGAHGGVALGMLRVEWDARGRVTQSKNEMIPLPPQIPDSPRMADIVEAARRESVAFAEEEARRSPPVTMPSLFAGSQACADCHEDAFRVWTKSGHAHAIDTLKKTGDQFNKQCLLCHVTGFEVTRGYVNYLRTPELGNVHCEACHGPARDHAGKPQELHPGLGDAQTYKKQVSRNHCLRCHTEENSPRFDFDTYWNKIKH